MIQDGYQLYEASFHRLDTWIEVSASGIEACHTNSQKNSLSMAQVLAEHSRVDWGAFRSCQPQDEFRHWKACCNLCF